MDNSSASWAPRPVLLVLGWLVAAAVAAGAVLSASADDKAGALLLGVAALGVGAFTAHGSLIRPRLAADVTGIRARTMAGTVELSWPETRLRLRTTRRLGRDGVTLEVDSADHLLVLGRLELGEDPRDVLEALGTLRPHGQDAPGVRPDYS